jgi:hypothetical protein
VLACALGEVCAFGSGQLNEPEDCDA